ncbi:hypothetical protein O1D97_11640 [Marinomonas sp. 15G1-11]|uniref:Uncharacterized protein n=1 Tax=Marinomonas phaeophyticola TaxID=3004091 RepID=A0ABT4JV41_9GAMM|nr:hypothetical protein [Marinomonas sp. 15G1-11]MCZ2722262.1 hypothetical protein [Marinomonas sp. 15G1-11]
MSRLELKEPDQWVLFIAMTIATINGVVTGNFFILLIGVPFILLSILVVTKLTLLLWILFISGAIINVILPIVSVQDYFSAAVYLLLVAYGGYELVKMVNTGNR